MLSSIVGIEIGRQRVVLGLRERFQLVVRPAVVVHHALAEALHLLAGALFLCELSEIYFREPAGSGLRHERLIRHRPDGWLFRTLREGWRGREGQPDYRGEHNITHHDLLLYWKSFARRLPPTKGRALSRPRRGWPGARPAGTRWRPTGDHRARASSG